MRAPISLRVFIAAPLIMGIVAAGCPAGKREDPRVANLRGPPASPLEAPPAAVTIPDAPGLNVEDLSARLRDAVAAASGIDVVDELSVRSELASCVEAPCPEVVAEKYRLAAFMVASSVSRVGDVYLTTVRVQRGAREVTRASSQAEDARVSVEVAGREAGARLREILLVEGVTERAAAR